MTMPHPSIVRFVLPIAVLAVADTSSAHGAQRSRADQRAAIEGLQSGRILPLREIEKRVVPQMRGAEYLGFDFDPSSGIYTLKFLRDGAVIWIDVDGGSGRIVGRSGR